MRLTTGPQSLDSAQAVSPHHLASEAALAVMDQGGTAVDGAIAANAVLGVVLPDTCGIGGDLFALAHRPGDERPKALNASGVAGSGVTAAQLRARGLAEIPPRSPWTITVPGCVDGWHALHDRFGKVGLRTVLGPAIELASGGFEVSTELARSLSRLHSVLSDQKSARPLYPEGDPPRPGETIRRPALARVLIDLAEGGRDAFYLGEVGDGIVHASEGAVSRTDLERVQCEWTDAVGLEVFGLRAWTVPPNSQGYVALAAAWMMDHLDIPADPHEPEYVHAAIESYRAVAWERDGLVSDPETAPMSPVDLLSPARLEARRRSIDLAHASPWPHPSPAPGGTAFLCTRDREGSGVSLIQSNFHGIGSTRSAGATGVFLHDRGAGFNLTPGHPNEYAPGRRPLHTLSPTLWTRGTDIALLLGTRGGHYQPQLLLQAAAHHLYAGDAPGRALERARWQVDGWQPDERHTVSIESTMPTRVAEGLRARGHRVRMVESAQEGWGPVSMIAVTDGTVEAAADPRVSTATAAAR